MGTTAQKLAKVKETKSGIKSSIENKGVSVPSDATFSSYPSYIDQIVSYIPSGNIEITAQTGTNVAEYETASVKSGEEGVPEAIKGIAVNNQIIITPQVSNIEGWIEGGEKTGNGVTVSVDELVSGNKSITASTSSQSDIDVTKFATVSVEPTPSEEKTATDNGTVTPSEGKLLSSVVVNVEYKTYRIGYGAPAASLGEDGDVYFDIS